MPRIARIVIPGIPHHVTQRGNNRQDVFLCDHDRSKYLSILREKSEKYGLIIHGYCLMTNHVHLIASPQRDDSLAKALGRTGWHYAQYFNKLYDKSGHLWQNRYYSCGLDERHFIAAMVYVERNPVRAKIVQQAWLYPWSSAKIHVFGSDTGGMLDTTSWSSEFTGHNWETMLSRPEDIETAKRLRHYTHHGRPLGSDSFVANLESTTGLCLRPRPRGRPKK